MANGTATGNQEPMTVIDGSMIQNNGERDEKEVSHVTHNDGEMILREVSNVNDLRCWNLYKCGISF